jgi:hypothetical protein
MTEKIARTRFAQAPGLILLIGVLGGVCYAAHLLWSAAP